VTDAVIEMLLTGHLYLLCEDSCAIKDPAHTVKVRAVVLVEDGSLVQNSLSGLPVNINCGGNVRYK
jgi:hypothetical protein